MDKQQATNGKFMKLSAIILGLALSLSMAVVSIPAFAEAPLRIVYHDFPPFHWQDGQGRMHGFFHDIITEAVEHRMGIPTVWEGLPWARCQTQVRNGTADAILTVPTPERAEYALASPAPFYIKQNTVFTYAEHPRMRKILALRELADIRKAGLSIITYHENGWDKANVKPLGIPVHTTNSLQGVWRMLANRRGDLVIEWPHAAWLNIRALGLERFIVQTKVDIASLPFHLLVGKHSPYADRLEEFSRVIRSMHEDGTLDRIIAGYQ